MRPSYLMAVLVTGISNNYGYNIHAPTDSTSGEVYSMAWPWEEP